MAWFRNICTWLQTYFLELKRPGNYATPKQKAIHKLLEYAGTHVFICKSLQDVYQSLVNIVPLKKHQAATNMILHEQTLEADIKKMKRLKKERVKNNVSCNFIIGVWFTRRMF